MTIASHAAASSGTTDLNSHNSASFTPQANSRLYAACTIMRGGHTTAPVWSDPGGGLSWTAMPNGETTFYPFGADSTYALQTKVWYADIGGAPSATSLTFSPATSGGSEYAAWNVWSQTNDEFNTTTPYPQAAVAGGAAVNPSSNTAGGTLSLGSAVTSGSKRFAFVGVGCNVAGGPTTPSGWTLVNTLVTAEYVNLNVYVSTTEDEIVFTDLGQDVGNWAGVIIEVAGVGGPPTQDITGTVGGIASGEAFGTAVINLSAIGPVGGIASAEAFGEPVVTGAGGTQAITGAGNIASAEAFGSTTVAPQGRTLTGVGNIASAENFISSDTGQTLSWEAVTGATGYRLKWGTSPGGPYTTGSEDTGNVTTYNVIDLALTPGTVYYMVVVPLDGSTEGNASVERVVVFGAAAVLTSNTLVVSGIASAETFGDTSVLGGTSITGAGNIASAEAFGSTTLTYNRAISGISGIDSAEAFGTHALNAAGGTTFITSAGDIASAEAFGTTSMAVGTSTLVVVGISSAQAFGLTRVFDPASPITTPQGWPRRRNRFGLVRDGKGFMDFGTDGWDNSRQG